MKLLIITQKVDHNDPILGFFHRWIVEFAKHADRISVICLEQGEYDLPKNVVVYSLGKELNADLRRPARGLARIKYITQFYRHIWSLRNEYDVVFVHMNQEYVLLGAPLWKLLGKKVALWRNHHFGNIFTHIAVLCSNKVFCTSKYSFTAQFKKTAIMPVGIDTNLFKRDESISRIPHSVLFLGRISPVKRPDMLIDAVALLKKENILVEAHLYGDPAPQDKEYFESLKKKTDTLGITKQVHFHPGIPNEKTPAIYNQYEAFVNASPSGMYDKTIFEAMACESLILTSNLNLRGQVDDMFIFEEGNAEDMAKKLKKLFEFEKWEKKRYGEILKTYVRNEHSINLLAQKFAKYFIL